MRSSPSPLLRLSSLLVALTVAGCSSSAEDTEHSGETSDIASGSDIAPRVDASTVDTTELADSADSAAPNDTALAPDTDPLPLDVPELDTTELDTTELDTTEPDSVMTPDVPDATVEDTSVVMDDTGPTNLFGTVAGSCGLVAAELEGAGPSFLENTYSFDEPFNPAQLSAGPKKRFDLPNAGGSSKCTEVMSLQLMIDCEGASLHKTENEVVYDEPGSLTDYVVTIDNALVGVSVTRAYLGPVVMEYSVEAATTLLVKKLEGVNESSANVSEDDAWVKQVLHIWTLQPDWVPLLEQAWADMSDELKADTIIMVTVEDQSTEIVTDTCDD